MVTVPVELKFNEPKFVVSPAPPIVIELPPRVARPVTERFPLSVSAPCEMAVRLLLTVRACKSKALMS